MNKPKNKVNCIGEKIRFIGKQRARTLRRRGEYVGFAWGFRIWWPSELVISYKQFAKRVKAA